MISKAHVSALLTAAVSITFAASPFFVQDFSGFDPDQFPVAQEDPPVVPAGYAFSIWGVIYLWLVVGMIWGLFRRAEDYRWDEMRRPLCVSLAVGTAWLAVAVVSPVWASVLIWIMLLTALTALFLSPEDDAGWATLPIGLYAGWLSAASCVSLGLLSAGYGLFSQETAALVFIGVAIALGAAIQARLRRAPTYGMAVIWALLAVAFDSWNESTAVFSLALAGAALVLLPTLRALR
ncbi:MAG: hypothetical protein AAF943_02500 [Pseudomonadota bacterium]